MDTQHHKNARETSPRFIAHAALLAGTVMACAMAAGQGVSMSRGSAPDRSADPTTTSHPNARPMIDVIREQMSERAHIAQAEDEFTPADPVVTIMGDRWLTQEWTMGAERLERFSSHMDTIDLSEASKYLAIQPMRNSPTAYTRNTLMLHGYDRLGVLARPYEHPNTGELAARPFLDAHTLMDMGKVDWRQFIESSINFVPAQPAP